MKRLLSAVECVIYIDRVRKSVTDCMSAYSSSLQQDMSCHHATIITYTKFVGIRHLDRLVGESKIFPRRRGHHGRCRRDILMVMVLWDNIKNLYRVGRHGESINNNNRRFCEMMAARAVLFLHGETFLEHSFPR